MCALVSCESVSLPQWCERNKCGSEGMNLEVSLRETEGLRIRVSVGSLSEVSQYEECERSRQAPMPTGCVLW